MAAAKYQIIPKELGKLILDAFSLRLLRPLRLKPPKDLFNAETAKYAKSGKELFVLDRRFSFHEDQKHS